MRPTAGTFGTVSFPLVASRSAAHMPSSPSHPVQPRAPSHHMRANYRAHDLLQNRPFGGTTFTARRSVFASIRAISQGSGNSPNDGFCVTEDGCVASAPSDASWGGWRAVANLWETCWEERGLGQVGGVTEVAVYMAMEGGVGRRV